MDSDTLNWILETAFYIIALINFIMWYFYGAVSSINFDNFKSEDEDISKKLIAYSDTYHTHLLALNMFIFGFSAYLTEQFALSYIYLIVIIILTIIFKHLGYYKAENISNLMIGISDIIYKIMFPFTFVISGTINILMKLFSLDVKNEYTKVTEDEILSLVNDGHEQGILDKEEAEMINNIVGLGEKEAMDIMTHRKNIIAIDSNSSIDEVFNIIISTNYSRYPIFNGDIDNITGIMHIRDFLKLYKENNKGNKLVEYKEIIRKAYFIPNTKNIDDIFKEMQSEKMHMAIVIDEFGQLDGIVTMEDIIEEIMGNILDEYDVDETMFIEQNNDKYLIRGICPLDILEDKLGIEFDDEYETLNGFLISKLNKIPSNEDETTLISYSGYDFLIKKVKNKVIQLVKVSKGRR